MLSVTLAAFMGKELVLASDAVRSLAPEALVIVRAAVLAVYYAVQLTVLVGLVRRGGRRFADALGLRARDRGARKALVSAGFVFVLLIGTRSVSTLYGLVSRTMGITPDSSVLEQAFGTTPVGLLLAGIMVVLIGPFVEECVFRGVLLQGLSSRMAPWAAIVVQAAMFAAFHRSWWLLFPMFVLGVALGWLARERQALWPAIVLHATYNAITIAAVAVMRA